MLIPTRTRLFVPRLGDGVVVADADPVGGVPARPERSKLESEPHGFKTVLFMLDVSHKERSQEFFPLLIERQISFDTVA